MNQVSNVDEVLTVEEVAELLKMKPSQIYTLTSARSQARSNAPLPSFKITSKALRFRKSQVLAWLDQISKAA